MTKVGIDTVIALGVGALTLIGVVVALLKYDTDRSARIGRLEGNYQEIVLRGSPGVALLTERVVTLEQVAVTFRESGSPAVVAQLATARERIAVLETWVTELRALASQGVLDDVGHQHRISVLEAHDRAQSESA